MNHLANHLMTDKGMYAVEVIVINDDREVVCITIRRADGAELRATWSELQALKEGYTSQRMFEVYPLFSEVIEHSNERHLWARPDMGFHTLENPRLQCWFDTFYLPLL